MKRRYVKYYTFRNVGFLLHNRSHVSGYNGQEAVDIYSGQDENNTTYYDAYQGWSSVRVYYKKTRSTFTRFYKGWHLNEVFNYKAINAISSNTIREGFMRDIKHSFFFDAEHTYHDQTGNSKLTLHNSPTIYSEGLNLIESETQYATLNGTTIGGTLTFAMWYNMHSESGSNYPRLFQFDDGTSTNNNLIAMWKHNTLLDATTYIGTTGQYNVGEVNATIPAFNTWNFVVWVINTENKTRELYINGVLSDSQTNISQTPRKIRRMACYIGQRYNLDRGYDGQIKSFNIWERALTGNEISTLYNLGRDYNIFNYTLPYDSEYRGTRGVVSAKKLESDEWTSYNQSVSRRNAYWNWSFDANPANIEPREFPLLPSESYPNSIDRQDLGLVVYGDWNATNLDYLYEVVWTTGSTTYSDGSESLIIQFYVDHNWTIERGYI